MNKFLTIIIVLASLLLPFGVYAASGSSSELMCRNRAKEIAAETYKNCVTDLKQSQVKNLRKEYEDKLSTLKKHYDQELRKISTGAGSSSGSNSTSGNNSTSLQSSDTQEDMTLQTKPAPKESYRKRSSGARELPVKEETQQPTPKPDLSNNTDVNSVEIVEITPEQE